MLADAVGLESIDREAQTVVLKFRQDAKVDPTRLFKLVQERGDLTLVPPATLKLSLAGPIQKPAPVEPTSGFRLDTGRGGSRAARPPRGKDPVASGSWWAARAKAGETLISDALHRAVGTWPRPRHAGHGRLTANPPWPNVTVPRQTGPGGKLTNHLEDGYDEEDTEAVHGGVMTPQVCWTLRCVAERSSAR